MLKNWIGPKAQAREHVDRGLVLAGVSPNKLDMFLYSINYYRVSGYGRYFYAASKDQYISGTTAAQLTDIYDLDRAVRKAVLDGVGVVEPTLRSRVAFHVAKVVGGGDGYLQKDLYLLISHEPSNPNAQQRCRAEVKNRDKVLDAFRAIQTRDEILIQHHINKGDLVPF